MFNLKIVSIMIFYCHFITNTELREVGVSANQLRKLLEHNYDDGCLTIEETPNGVWVRTYQEENESNRVTKPVI